MRYVSYTLITIITIIIITFFLKKQINKLIKLIKQTKNQIKIYTNTQIRKNCPDSGKGYGRKETVRVKNIHINEYGK